MIAGVKVWVDSNLIQILMIFGASFSKLQNSKSKKQYMGVINVMCHFIWRVIKICQTCVSSYLLSYLIFAINELKSVVDLHGIKLLYHANFNSLLRYGLIFGEDSVDANKIFILQKRALRTPLFTKIVPSIVSCKLGKLRTHITYL